MRIAKRRVALAAVLGAAAVTTAIPMVVSGTASAQTNARLCGRTWLSPNTDETVTKIYEVEKKNDIICWAAQNGQDPGDSPFKSELKDQKFDGYISTIFYFEQCEGWKERHWKTGGLGSMPLVHPDGTPLEHQADICLNMERSDNAGDMERYWLLASPTSTSVKMARN